MFKTWCWLFIICRWFSGLLQIVQYEYHWKSAAAAYLPEKRSPFRSTAFSWQKSNSSSVGYQISEDYIWQEVILCTHLKYVKKKGLKACNILKVIGNTEWRADRKGMLCLYRSLVKSKLDYEYIVYGSTRKSYLQILDLVHNQGLRLCLGAFRTSPVESLHILY